MLRILLLLILALLVGICVGQTAVPTTSFTLSASLMPNYQEKVTATGHYLYLIDDPQNVLRCGIAANNQPGGAPTIYVITCMQFHNAPVVQ